MIKKEFRELLDDPFLDDEYEKDLAWAEGIYLELFDGNWDDALAGHIDNPGSTSGKVYNPSFDEWPAVINSTNHLLTITEIRHSDVSIEWNCTVRTGNTVGYEAFSISGHLPLPVVRCLSMRTDSLSCAAFPGDPPVDFTFIDAVVDWPRLTDELFFITLQILEGRFNGSYSRNGITTTQEQGETQSK